MQKSLVVNPHTLGSEYRAFIAIDMVHELDLLSGDSTELTLTRTELGSKLTKSGIYLINHKKLVRRRCIKTESILVVLCQGEMFIVVGYLGANADLIQSCV